MPETVLGTGAKCCGQDCGVTGCPAPEKAEVVEAPSPDELFESFGLVDEGDDE